MIDDDFVLRKTGGVGKSPTGHTLAGCQARWKEVPIPAGWEVSGEIRKRGTIFVPANATPEYLEKHKEGLLFKPNDNLFL